MFRKVLITFVVIFVFLTGCSPQATPTTEPTRVILPTEEPEVVEPASVFIEAPQLADLVAAGELPPVDERLPKNPMVIQPVERVGTYGGTWRMGITESSDLKFIRVNAGYENLLRWDPNWSRVIPNIAQSYEVNEDSSEFIFHLREGLKWSDGVPFTADDIVFWYEADLMNNELHDSIQSRFVVNGIPVQVEKIDAITVKFSFAGSYGQFLSQLADLPTDEITATPMHYMKQFHPDYNPDGIDALIAEAGAEDWVELWKNKVHYYQNPEMPTINAWVLTEWFDENSPFIIMERNPYYWKVDTDFNQLPYIDRIQFTVFPSNTVITQAAMDGQIDMQYISLGIRQSNYDDWAAKMTTGDYDLHTLINPRSNYLSIQLNLVHQDPVLREVFNNKTFRIALSEAIDRNEIIDQVLGIPLEVRQPAPLRESPYYREQLATQYTMFDLPHANQLLDEAGYDKRDFEGYRLTPEEQRIEFTLSMVNDAIYKGAAEMVAEYWQDLGILVHIEEQDGLTNAVRSNEYDAIISSVNGGLDVVENPGIYLPFNESDSFYAIQWLYWYQDHSLGEEPPEPVKEQMQLYDQIKSSTDPDEIKNLMGQILTIAEDNFFVMGISKPEEFYLLVKTNFLNVPWAMPKSFSYPTPAPTNPCQYFIDVQE
ncbi:MAG: ABC transporter substrate-binding protein [Chloroflexota bacterium]